MAYAMPLQERSSWPNTIIGFNVNIRPFPLFRNLWSYLIYKLIPLFQLPEPLHSSLLHSLLPLSSILETA